MNYILIKYKSNLKRWGIKKKKYKREEKTEFRKHSGGEKAGRLQASPGPVVSLVVRAQVLG